MVQHEPVAFIDLTGSQEDPIAPGSDTKRKVVTLAAFKVFVRKLQEMDDAATAAALAGHAEVKGGGILSFGFQGTSVVELGDVNPGNFDEVVSGLRFGGRTYIMPALAKWQEDRDEEFSQDEIRDINREFDLLFLTDGLIYDEDRFLSWVGQTPENHKVFFCMIGYDEDTAEAIQGYQRIARQYPNKVHFYDMTHTANPEAIATQMMQALS